MWLIFSYTLPAKNPNVRVKVWRRLLAVGAVQLKNSLYVLPFSDTNYEHLQWLAREVEELGGEAVFFQAPAVENLGDAEIKALFGKVRDDDYARLHGEIRAFLEIFKAAGTAGEEAAKEVQGALKKFSRRFQAIQEIDFFPSGRAETTAMLLASLSDRLQALTGAAAAPFSLTALKQKDYQGKTWVTRESPYIDRLASIWLIKRFIDRDAQIRFISPREAMKPGPDVVYFDLAGGEFIHRDQMVTFEVLTAAFSLADRGVTHLGAMVRSVDLKEDLVGMEEAKTLQDLIDGLVKITPDDHGLVERALIVFDALYAAYHGGTA